MSNFKGFGSSNKRKQTSNKNKKKVSPTFSLKFEKYVARYLGEDWSEGLSFNTFSAENFLSLIIEVPQESHSIFTKEYQQQIQDLAKKFGIDDLEFHLVNLPKNWLRHRAKIRFSSSSS